MLYCIYCGEDEKKGHNHSLKPKCPLVSLLGTGSASNVIKGFDSKFNFEQYLNLERLNEFLRKHYVKFDNPKKKKIRERLVYEQVAHSIRKLKENQHSLKESKFMWNFVQKINQRKLEKEIETIKRFAKAWGMSISKFNKLFDSEKIIFADFSDSASFKIEEDNSYKIKAKIPYLRESKTNELKYYEVLLHLR